jgi:AraC family transcriptional regulator, arabinose operon regulatory protein
MEDYNKIIEALGISYISSRNFSLRKDFCIKNLKDVSNTMIINHKGSLYYNGDKEVKAGDILFISGGRATDVCFGAKGSDTIAYDEFINDLEAFTKGNANPDAINSMANSFTFINFDAKIFDAVSYFTSLDIPAFPIEKNKTLVDLFALLLKEVNSDRAGKVRLVKNIMDQIVVEVMRYIMEEQLFLEQLATNTTYFKDPRLIDIFKFIKENLGGDLSNKMLAKIARVSEDYVGQYFKMLTGINPQDYIEYQRMEKAVNLLRTTKISIRQVGKEVGYKDTAYFCRRFKMMFGIPAGKMRRREITTI